MAKTKISAKRRNSSVKLTRYEPGEKLKDPKTALETLLYCLTENDLESFQDVLIAHLRTVSKSKLAKETKLGRQTLYDLIDGTKTFNPTLSTLGPLFHSLKKAG